jgi:hypothetical protein
MNWKKLGFVAIAATMVAACDSPLEVDPTSFIPFDEALDSPDEIAGAVNGMYDAFQADGGYNRDLIAYPDLYTDNLDFTGTFTTDREVWLRNVRSTNGSVAGIWQTAYIGISRANNVLAAVDSVDELTDEDAQQYQGEAYFVRALNYHNLVRFFSGVPLVTRPTWEIGGAAGGTDVARSSQAQVYQAIVTDLMSARNLLGTLEEDTGTRPLVGRASVRAVEALLARVYLDMGQYENARAMATAVIASGEFGLVPEYANIFRIKNNSESIFEVQYTVNDPNSLAFWFYPSASGGRLGFQPTRDYVLATAYSSEEAIEADSTDSLERLFGSVAFDESDGYYVNKYNRIATGDDNIPVLRLPEMYLIRAEANWRLNQPAATVVADINRSRVRVGLAPLPGTLTRDQLGAEILLERRREFAFEGMRLFDLRRILGAAGAAAFLEISQDRLLFPIPQRELEANRLLTQNPGY